MTAMRFDRRLTVQRLYLRIINIDAGSKGDHIRRAYAISCAVQANDELALSRRGSQYLTTR